MQATRKEIVAGLAAVRKDFAGVAVVGRDLMEV
jgi:hypothetical protein